MQKIVKNYGKVARPIRDKSGYAFSRGLGGSSVEDRGSAGYVDQIEISETGTVVLKRPNGKTIEMPLNRINP